MKLWQILAFVAILGFAIWVNFRPVEAKMSGECWIGGKISEQTSTGCRYLENKRYVGLYGFRNSKRHQNTNNGTLRLSTQYKR